MELNSQTIAELTADFFARGGQIDTPTRVWNSDGTASWMSGFTCRNYAGAKPASPPLSSKRHRRPAAEIERQREEADAKRRLREEAYDKRIADLRRFAAEGMSGKEAMIAAGLKEFKTLTILSRRHAIVFVDGRSSMAAPKRKALTDAVLKDRANGLNWPEVAKKHKIAINTARRIAKEATQTQA